MKEIGILLVLLGLYLVLRPEPEVRYAMREEVAVVVLKSIHGKDYTPPPAEGIFADMKVDYWGTKWAEQAYREGLFIGCGELNGKPLFCPGGN